MSTIQPLPICFECREPIETGVVFACPCGEAKSDDYHHASVCWHGLCLMAFRERMERVRVDQASRVRHFVSGMLRQLGLRDDEIDKVFEEED